MKAWKPWLCLYCTKAFITKRTRERERVFVIEVGDKGTGETHKKVFIDYLACVIQTFLPLWFDWDTVPLSFSTRQTDVQKAKVCCYSGWTVVLELRTHLESKTLVPIVSSRLNQFKSTIGKILALPTSLAKIFRHGFLTMVYLIEVLPLQTIIAESRRIEMMTNLVSCHL